MADSDDVAEQNEHDMDLNALSKMIEQNRDVIVGIKIAHWQQPNFNYEKEAGVRWGQFLGVYQC
jgi:hypothetical protein